MIRICIIILLLITSYSINAQCQYEKIIEGDTLQIVETLQSEVINDSLQFIIRTGFDKNEYLQLAEVVIVEKGTNNVFQILSLGNIDWWYYKDRVEVNDYNFDGYQDFSVFETTRGLNSFSYYFLYNPNTGKFYESEELRLSSPLFMDDKTIIESIVWSDRSIINKYKFVDNKLVLLATSDSTYFFDVDMIPDSIVISKEWTDKNGKNILTIQGRNLCNPDYEYGAVDGFPSKIEVALVNDKYKLFLTDSLTFDQYQMQTMLIREKEIWITTFNRAQIVFIPIFYCGNYDIDMRISYVILYGNQRWLIHIQYLYEIEGDGFIKLNDDLKRKLDFIQPKKLRSKIIEQISQKYKTAEEYENVFQLKTEH